MALSVKPGREYVLGGKVYKGRDEVPEDQVPAKFKALLTSARGPLSAGPASSPTDLPAAAMLKAVVAETPAEAHEAAPAAEAEEAAPEAPAPSDLQPPRHGRGWPDWTAKPSPSSRPARRRKGKT
jgi:hypothetical protein